MIADVGGRDPGAGAGRSLILVASAKTARAASWGGVLSKKFAGGLAFGGIEALVRVGIKVFDDFSFWLAEPAKPAGAAKSAGLEGGRLELRWWAPVGLGRKIGSGEGEGMWEAEEQEEDEQ
jgi:hypothetical protein